MHLSFKARELAQYHKADLWQLPDARVSLTFDDETIQSHTRAVIYNAYIWRLHLRFPSIPMLSRHALGNQRFSLKKHLDILSNIYRDFIDTYYHDGSVTLEQFWKAIYEVTNEIENDFKLLLEPHIASVSITDFLDLIEHPQIKEANWNVQPNQSSINATYRDILDTLENDDTVADNPISFVHRSEIVDSKQILQCIGPRGFCTDINSRIFQKPIMYGFAHGLRLLFDAMIESRSATKALIYQTGSALENSQYFNRELQILGSNVREIVPGDCGSRHTVPYRVKSSQIGNLKGIYYHDDKGQLRMIEGDRHKDADIIGEVVNIRTPFSCIHPERQAVCTTCFGAIGMSIPKGTNPGHVSAIALGEVISQLVLSTKHVEGSSEVDSIDLDETYQHYLVKTSDELSLQLAKEIVEHRTDGNDFVLPGRIQIELTPDQGEQLALVFSAKELEEYKPEEVTQMDSVVLATYDEQGEIEERIQVPISKGSRLGSLSYNLLVHLRDRGYEITSQGYYAIDLGGWMIHHPLFTLPLKHTSMSAFQEEVKKFIFSKAKDDQASLRSFVNAGEPKNQWTYAKLALAVETLHDFVTSKIPSINLSHILMITYAMSARDPYNDDYRLPRGGEDFRICINDSRKDTEELLRSRSIGMMMGYQAHQEGPNSVKSYTLRDGRPSHPMDEFLVSDDS